MAKNLELKIEKNIAIPAKYKAKPRKYPWRELKVGESFLIPCNTSAERSHAASGVLQAARGSVWSGKLTTRCCPEGVRVWRIK